MLYLKPCRVLVALILFIGAIAQLSSQPINKYIGDVAQPSPEVAAMGTYLETPVSKYTGVPSIGVPIHTVTAGGLQLPVSLSYHAGGVNVASPATNVGTGWTLMAGGSISRTVRGIADDQNGGWYFEGQQLDIDNDYEEFRQVMAGEKDSEPDVFSYSVLGYSGKFYFDGGSPSRVITLPSSDVIIKPFFGTYGFSGFELILPDGSIARFGIRRDEQGLPVEDLTAAERIQPDLTAASTQFTSITFAEYLTSWSLTEYESADGLNRISLRYEEEVYDYFSKASTLAATYRMQCLGSGGGQANYSTVNPTFSRGRPFTNMTRFGGRLVEISAATNQVNISYGANRLDLSSNTFTMHRAKELAEITVREGAVSEPAVICKQYSLHHSYYRGNRFARYRERAVIEDYDAGEAYRYRLRLDSVTISSCDGTASQPAHGFEYSEIGQQSGGYPYFPNRLSNAVDHWGYYNGEHGNDYLILNAPPTTVGNFTRGEANRDVSRAHAKIGNLTSYSLPTGGTINYEFESNTARNLTIPPLGVEQLFSLRTCESGTQINSNSNCCSYGDDNDHATFSKSYVFASKAAIDQATFSLRLIDDFINRVDNQSCRSTASDASLRLEIVDPTGTMVAAKTLFFGDIGNDERLVEGTLRSLETSGNTLVSNITYELRLIPSNARGQFNMRTRILREGIVTNQPVGGLRIQRISFDDGGANPPITTT